MKKIINVLKKIYIKEQFYPGILGIFLNPFYLTRREILRNISSLSTEIKGKVLDLGCGTRPYEFLFSGTNYVGLELDLPEKRRLGFANVFYEGGKIPFEDNSFDSLVSFQVLEHVKDIKLTFSEMARVVKPGGKILITVPFMWEEHESPFDFRRYSSFGIKEELENYKFEIISQNKSTSGMRAIIQIFLAHTESVIRNTFKFNYLSLVITLILSSFFNILSLLIPRKDHSLLFLDNIVLAKNIK